MMKSIRTLVRQDREKYTIPRRVQDVIPIQKIWEDGIFLTGGRFAKPFRFTDINYQVASAPDKEKMFRGYSALINSLDCSATTKITITGQTRFTIRPALTGNMTVSGNTAFKSCKSG